MAEKEKISMPMGFGGLIRYTEEEKPLIKIKPKQLIGAIIGVILFEIFLKILA